MINDEVTFEQTLENIVFDFEEMFDITDFEAKRNIYDMVKMRLSNYHEDLVSNMEEANDDYVREELGNAKETIEREIRDTLPEFLDRVKGWEDDEDFDILQEIADYAIDVSNEIS